MQVSKQMHGPATAYKHLAFISSGSPDADAARDRLVAIHGDAPLGEADVVVALGGDGLMLQTLHAFMGSNTPIYGMNRGSVGFLMNEYREPDLIERLSAAKASVIHPLLMNARNNFGETRTSPRHQRSLDAAADLSGREIAPLD